MTMRLYTVVVDSRDPQSLARWWAEALGWKLVCDTPEEAAIDPQHAREDHIETLAEWNTAPMGMVFVPVPEGKTVKNRLHIDLAPHASQDRAAEIQRLIDLGAVRVDVGQDRESVTWEVLADPEGNEFCVLSSRKR